MSRQLLIATRNAHKTREIARILGENYAVTDLTAHPEIPATVESGTTFRENAELKAVEASRIFDGLVLSDDSGLEVDALGGAPGVYSARYAGENADDAANRRRLLDELARAGACGREARTARFRCVMALAEHGEVTGVFDGTVEGVIIDAEKGAGGFGYDSLFIPDGFSETFAELPDDAKNGISHRGRALEKAREFLMSRKS